LTFVDQVHGADVVRVGRSPAGSGAGGPARGDGMVTEIAGIPLVILTADCLPIILADPGHKVVAAVHAGWRGTFEMIAANAVKVMVDAGADPAAIEARFGPYIGGCCYEVGEDLYARFAEKFALPAAPVKPSLDLGRLNRSILIESGVRPQGIKAVGLCTRDDPGLFYSWRRDGVTGRQAAVAAIMTPAFQTNRLSKHGLSNQSQNPGVSRQFG